MMQEEPLKFIIHRSDYYYPDVDEYDDYVTAMREFSKLKEQRMDEVENSNHPFFEKDYLCIVISEIDVKRLQELIKSEIDDERD